MITSTIKSGAHRGDEVEFSRSDEAGLAASTRSAIPSAKQLGLWPSRAA